MPTIAYDPSEEALFRPETRATVFGPGPAPSTALLAIEAARLAYARAEESAEAQARLGADLAAGGFGALRCFQDAATGSQGFAALRSSDGLGLLAFRGTQADKPRDLITDLRFLKTAAEGWPGAVHTGFAAAAAALWPQIDAWLQGDGAARTRLLVCGHSLGAAIATLVALRAQADELVTIGSPRVGDEDFATAFAAQGPHTLRIVDHLDVVTRVPLTAFGYRHVGEALLIDADGQLVDSPRPEQVDTDVDLGQLGRLLGHLFGPLPRDLSDHAPVNYLRAFRDSVA